MKDSGFKAQEAIFMQAIEMPPSQRPAFLDQACAGNPDLRQAIEALLRSHGEATTFLADPPTEVTVTRAAGRSAAIAEKIGAEIGRYKLLQQIGEGGCGVVYMAEQQTPVRRQVALKVIKLGMDTRQVIARFEAERQALALMDHPNIAKVLDAGATETGRPYFVMELVRGIKITEFCDKHQLTTAQRLKLFIQVCHAVQHAHQNGIIHRDLKPSNILVTLNDGIPLPKVIDFGIAKATQHRLTDKTLFTAFEQFLGTPAYMSPEQAEMNAQGVDTRSDIYSLGVLLYELLTGRTPFESHKLLQAGVDEIRRIIREVDPQRPSTKLSTLLAGELTTAASLRHTRPPQLIHAIRGDLDWIAMKSLEKDRNRRYETVTGLARDIERYLTDEPVTASPPSRLYQLRKTIRRHKFAFALAISVLLALMAGLALSSYFLLQETRAKRAAVADREKAQSATIRSQQLARFLQEMLRGADPYVAAGHDTTLLQAILDKTAERARVELTNAPEVKAAVLDTVGETYMSLRAYAKAEEMHRQAIDLWRKLPADRAELANSLHDLGFALEGRGQLVQADKTFRDAVEIARQIRGTTNTILCDALVGLGQVQDLRGIYAEAEKTLREALAITQNQPGNETRRVSVLENLGDSLAYQERFAEAEPVLRQAVLISETTVGTNSLETANIYFGWGTLLYREKKYSEAEAPFHKALAIEANLKIPGHPDLTGALRGLINVLMYQHKTVEARSLLATYRPEDLATTELLQPQRELFARMGLWKEALVPAKALVSQQPGDLKANLALASLLAADGNSAEYKNCCLECLKRFGDTLDPSVAHWLVRICMLSPVEGLDWNHLQKLAEVQMSQGEKTFLADDEMCKAVIKYRAGNFSESLEWIQKAIRDRPAKDDDDVMAQLGHHALLAMCYFQLQKPDLAKAAMSDVEKLYAKVNELTKGDLGMYWKFWVLHTQLYGEARALAKKSVNLSVN